MEVDVLPGEADDAALLVSLPVAALAVFPEFAVNVGGVVVRCVIYF